MPDDQAAYTSGSLLQGGLGSTTETLTGFVKAMIMFPNVVKAAQDELDRVCGHRMPELDDAPELPYVRGCVKESLRWMPASPLGIPHALTRDDEYIGYRLPKGATVIYNVRSVPWLIVQPLLPCDPFHRFCNLLCERRRNSMLIK